LTAEFRRRSGIQKGRFQGNGNNTKAIKRGGLGISITVYGDRGRPSEPLPIANWGGNKTQKKGGQIRKPLTHFGGPVNKGKA